MTSNYQNSVLLVYHNYEGNLKMSLDRVIFQVGPTFSFFYVYNPKWPPF